MSVNRVALSILYDNMRSDMLFDHFRQIHGRLVEGEGPNNPDCMIIGEAPGGEELTAGRPFVGRAGRVLRQLMHFAGLSTESNTWLTNVVKYRPERNRTPYYVEIRNSMPYLRKEHRLIGKPQIIIPVGTPAWVAVTMGTSGGIMRVAGRMQMRKGYYVWPMIHPSYALRNESMRPTVEHHWEKLGDWLDWKLERK